MRFNHCYVTNSICTSSRAAILTGTHNHVNGVTTLDSKINKRLPNVAKKIRTGGYQTAMIGKWHLGEGKDHEPTGFDYWSVVPGQGEYHDPQFIGPEGMARESGYATDIITDKSLNWIRDRDTQRPFFLMCHHKAPRRSWEYDAKHRHLYTEPARLPDTFTDDYKDRARAAKVAKMRVAEDLTYTDLALVQTEGGVDLVGPKMIDSWSWHDRKVPSPEDVTKLRLMDKENGAVFTFQTPQELAEFKFQRYIQRYLRTIQSIDNVGRMLDFLGVGGLAEDTIVIYTSDQGFFLGGHGWFDKRFIYEESFQMPFLIRYPRAIAPGSICDDIICNVDFASTYMQGVAYHRYWMHRDRYKLIYWFNEDFGLEGTRPGGQEKEWELFDCEQDPLELFNCYNDPELLEKMEEIGDEPIHEVAISTQCPDILRIVTG
ncbi:alkaline-phosphatase-like protein [Aspergillus aurantiobrunneus]